MGPERQPPLVSVCIPTFNGGRFIDAALSSALAQDYPNVEVVIVDDASTDDTVSRLRTAEGAGVRVFCHARRRGHNMTWNETIERAHGALIKFLHQDDQLRH